MYYLIKDTLKEVSFEDCIDDKSCYVAVISKAEFEEKREQFDLGVDMDMVTDHVPLVSCVVVNYDSLTGSFNIPDRNDLTAPNHGFSFALDEKGIVFLNDDGTALKIIQNIMQKKRWKLPSLERFIYDFMEQIIINDLPLLERYEKELDVMEDSILAGNEDSIMSRLVDIRGEILDLRAHYEQLIDMGQEFEENENSFFSSKNLRFFRMFTERTERLLTIVTNLKDHTMQVRDLYHAQLEKKQNKIMTFLTIISTIFMPLTLIVGWYGMNFKYMPELDSPVAYPIVIIISLIILIGGLIWAKKNKWI